MDLMDMFGYLWNDVNKMKSKTHKWHMKERHKVLRHVNEIQCARAETKTMDQAMIAWQL